MKKIILLLSFLFISNAFGLKDKTIVVFINGDWFYQGPQIEEEGIRLKDQAKVLYNDFLSRAKADKENDYVLFYDPKGKGNFLNRKWVKFRIFKKGKSLYSHKLKDREVSTSSQAFRKMFSNIVKKNLGLMKEENSLFYYYGEHFPAHYKTKLDLSSSEGTSLGDIILLMDSIGRFHTSIFHTCYLNAVDFVGPLLNQSKTVIVPEKAILNIPLNLKNAFEQNSLESFSDVLKRENSSSEKYKMLKYGSETKFLIKRINSLKNLVSQKHWFEMLEFHHERTEKEFQEISKNGFFLKDWNSKKKKEIFLPFYDYINLIDRYLLDGDEILDDIDQLIDANDDYLRLFILLPEPIS